jgi:hypothetical protein
MNGSGLSGLRLSSVVMLACAAVAEAGPPLIQVHQLSFTDDQGAFVQRFSNHGQLSITVAEPPTDQIQWVNAVINGTWAIENAPLIEVDGAGGSQTYSYPFDLGVLPGVPVPVADVVFTITPFQREPTDPPKGPPVIVTVAEHLLYAGATVHAPMIKPLHPVPGLAQPNTDPANPIPWERVRRRDVPGVAEEVNHCAPGAHARSLAWMNDLYCLGLPKDCDEAQEIYDALAGKMGTTAEGGTTTKSKDCTSSNAVTGLQSFLEQKDLEDLLDIDWRPDFADDPPDPCDLFEALQQGKDVIVEVGWLDADNNRTNGHVITVVGAVKCGDMVRIFYKDDAYGDDSQGDNSADDGVKTAKFEAGGPTGWRLRGFRGASNQWEGYIGICPKPLTMVLAILKWILVSEGLIDDISMNPDPTSPEVQELIDTACDMVDISCSLLAQIEIACPEAVETAQAIKEQALTFKTLAEFLQEEITDDTLGEMQQILARMDMRLQELEQKFDCNANGVSDDEDIENGTSSDVNGNGVPDECECPSDTNGDLVVDVDDLLNVLLDWDTDGSMHNGDVNGDGIVDVDDLLQVVLDWGDCG